MNQSGNKIQGENLQDFLDSAANAAHMGQRQFFTPKNLATALFTPMKRLNIQAGLDFQCGSGHLLEASGAGTRFALDIDARSPAEVGGKFAYQADCTRWFGLAADARLEADLIAINPPFSLQWYADRFDALARSTRPGVPEAFAAANSGKVKLIDSTAASFLMALQLLSDPGEGLMVCNAATARRLFGNPEDSATVNAPLASVRRYIWTWLEIPGLVFDGVQTVFDTAVLYFARGHGYANPKHPPLFLAAPSADPATVERTLTTALTSRHMARHGREVLREYEADAGAKRCAYTWNAVREEVARTSTLEDKPAWNIWLHQNGTIARNLTTFQKLTVHPQTINLLDDLEGRHPAGLVVQQATRAALKTAVESGIWRVHPAVQVAVRRALDEYESVRAPFFAPNAVQSLGWLDEESAITCSERGLAGVHPGDSCPVSTWIEDTSWSGTRISLTGKREDFTFKGKQLVVQIIAPDGTHHQFHIRRDDEAKDSREEKGIWHHDVTKLISHFHVPCPKDIAQLHPEKYQGLLARLDMIEAKVAARLATAA